MRLVYQHENRGLVYSVKNLLSMHNIDCLVKNEFGNPMGAEFGINNTLLELWVSNDDDYLRARKIIDDQEKASNDQPWICPNCGEENGEQFALCWNCQFEFEEK